jgi:ankyrin repeat protein
MGLDPNYVTPPTWISGCQYDHYEYLDESTPREAIYSSVERGDVGATKYLIEQKKLDLSIVDNMGRNPLHMAIGRGIDDITLPLLAYSEHTAREALHDADLQGYTPLMIAVEKGNLPVVQRLIAMGASIREGQDANCDPDTLARKTKTLATAQLLLETKCNIAAAQFLALKRNVSDFEGLFADQHTALRSACARGDLGAARALVDSGVDASLVLMRMIDTQPSPDAARGRLVKPLILAGADLTQALTYAIAANREPTVRALLMFDAPGQEALRAAVERNDDAAVKLLMKCGVSGELALAQYAIDDNRKAVNFMLTQTLDTKKVFDGLAKGNYIKAITMLLARQLDPLPALMQLLDDGKSEAVKTMLRAGVNPSKLLEELAAGDVDPESPALAYIGNTPGIQQFLEVLGKNWASATLMRSVDYVSKVKELALLIACGADPSKTLYGMLMGEKRNQTAAKLLICAGADPDATLKYAKSANARRMLNPLLAEATAHVRKIQSAVKLSDPEQKMKAVMAVIGAQDYFSDSRSELLSLLTFACASVAKNAKLVELAAALLKGDWPTIAALVAADQRASASMLFMMHGIGNDPVVRLLACAEADVEPLATHYLRAGNVPAVSDLRRTGFPWGPMIWAFLQSGCNETGRAYLKHIDENLFSTFDGLHDSRVPEVATRFIPALTDGLAELIDAVKYEKPEVTNWLIEAGVSREKALVTALSKANTGVVKELIKLGADPSVALAEAVAGEHQDLAQILLSLGADPSRAYKHAEHMDDRANVQRQLGHMMEY